ncbi:MAG TPA: hypothetical protein VKE25_00335 [Actinomycetes bacterium]|nr:hypothetical protein [Actinomycetes bacterium]
MEVLADGTARTAIDDVPPQHPAEPQSDGAATGSVSPTVLIRIPLGLAMLVAERIRADLNTDLRAAGTGTAFLVGLGDAAVATASRVARAFIQAGQRPARVAVGLAESGLNTPPLRFAREPALRLQAVASDRFQATVLRGRAITTTARAEAIAFLNAESANGIAWVQQQVTPTLIDDLTTDPKVRELAMGQAQGALADAARELRQRSASADGWVESSVRRLFGRSQSRSAPLGPQPADG